MSDQFNFDIETDMQRVRQYMRYMDKHGHTDTSHVYSPKHYAFRDTAKSKNIAFDVSANLQVYANVQSFLYSIFFSAQRKHVLYTAKILSPFKGRMAYFEWDVHPLFIKMEDISPRDKVSMMFTVIPFLQEKVKGWGALNPVGNEPVVGRVAGHKSGEGKTWDSMKRGTKQREKMAMRIGFGNTGLDNNCYAYYDENCVLQPLMVDTEIT